MSLVYIINLSFYNFYKIVAHAQHEHDSDSFYLTKMRKGWSIDLFTQLAVDSKV